MSLPRLPTPAKLVVGLLLKDRPLMNPVSTRLSSRFGTIDMVSPWYDFQFTKYYEKEMGTPLWRRFLVFKPLVDQDAFPGLKTITNTIEREFTEADRRRVNIDPGMLLLERFVLATGKNFSHRIYLSEGIYADLTLVFSKGAFQSLPWTYPDYRSAEVLTFLGKVRKKYAWDLKAASAVDVLNEDRGNDR